LGEQVRVLHQVHVAELVDKTIGDDGSVCDRQRRQVHPPSPHWAAARFASRLLKVLPPSASFVSSGAGAHRAPCCSSNSRIRSWTAFSPTVSAYHIGPPRWAGNP